MIQKKYHIFLGILCLVVSIVLPTFIYLNYLEIKSLCETVFNYMDYQATAYAFLVFLSFLWIGSLIVALRELGGFIIHLDDRDHSITHAHGI